MDARAATEHHLSVHGGRRRWSCGFIFRLKPWTSALQNHIRFRRHKCFGERGRVFFRVIFCYALTLLFPADYNQDIAKFSRPLFLILSLPCNSLTPLTHYHNGLAGKSNCGNSGPFCCVKDRTISGLPFIPSARAQGKHNLLQGDSSTLTLSGMGTCSSLTRNSHTSH